MPGRTPFLLLAALAVTGLARARAPLALSDGRSLPLPQALSASGARYASADGRTVFWNKGRSAFLEEGGRTT
jgi:membrane-bound inhibitor of C-type lysozyme